MMTKPLLMVMLVVLAVTGLAAAKCSHDCKWADEELTLCDDRFKSIFSGKVVRAVHKPEKALNDYDVEITEVFRPEDRYVTTGAVLTLRTKLDSHICPVRQMAENDYLYFAVGPQIPENNYRIDVDTCNSYVRKSYEFTGTVFADLLNGNFNQPC